MLAISDSSLINSDDWCACCVQHDMAYWKGGTESERLAADEALRDCVIETTGNHELAEAMFLGVRFGGVPTSRIGIAGATDGL